ncbi:hypothetical protein [Gorillibacterium timonense]|uniref:hypothetical protein n=1 Tax=Gorillibacterium timonense TaxID=1689269 RepID=UPI00071C26DE|nr:hypothetical protein [Gorillibacterium timonense]
MNRDEKRHYFQRFKKMTANQFWAEMDILHSRAYGMAQKHYEEAMDIKLTPKQKAAVVTKAHEIRELWDGMREIAVEATEDEQFIPEEVKKA